MTGRGRYSRSVRSLGIVNPDAPCSFKGYHCCLPRIDGFEYCIRHILEDKIAPFQHCSYIYPNSNKICIRAAPARDRKESFCRDHAYKVFKMRQKTVSFNLQQTESPEMWLDQLSHHFVAPQSGIQNTVPDLSSVPSVASMAVEYDDKQSGTSNFFSTLDMRLMPRLEDDSEMDYTESDVDPLEHAGVYTSEEASRIYLEKLKKLKSLYVGEFKHLFHILRENRRQYLHAQKIEKETMMSIHGQPKETKVEREAYKELKALSRYHRSRGREAVLQKKKTDKRHQLADGGNCKSSNFVKCIYSEGSWRCGERSIPMAKHCFKHILEDPCQVLFQLCGSLQGGEECLAPVIPLPHTPQCIYHTPIPSHVAITKSSSSPPYEKNQSEIVNISSSNFMIVPEVPPDNVMEGDFVSRDGLQSTTGSSISLNHSTSGMATRSTSKRK